MILGIIASIALPRFSVSVDDAKIAKAKVQIAQIRAGIALFYNQNLMRGVVAYPDATLGAGGAGSGASSSGGTGSGGASGGATLPLESGECCFGFVLQAPLADGSWSRGAGGYTLTLGSRATTFSYDPATGKFACNRQDALCKEVD